MQINRVEKNLSFAARKKLARRTVAQGHAGISNAGVASVKIIPMPIEKNAATFIKFHEDGAGAKELHAFLDNIESNVAKVLVDINYPLVEGKTFVRALRKKIPNDVVLRLIEMTDNMYKKFKQPNYVKDIIHKDGVKSALRNAGILEKALEIVKKV